MRLRFSLFLCFSLLIIPSLAFSKTEERKEAIQHAFDGLKHKLSLQEINYSPEPVDYAQDLRPAKKTRSIFSQRHIIIDKILDEVELSIAVKIGYMTGETIYDFNHHASELTFPFDNWMGGVDFSLGMNRLSLNAGFWGSLQDETGSKNTNKDWTSGGLLFSSTESVQKIDAIIWDANLRYDFYDKNMSRSINPLLLKTGDEVKIGLLLGYKFERFDFDLYDLYQTLTSSLSNEGERVGTYKVKYWLPYVGIAADVLRKKCGFSLNLKIPFHPTAEDVDNHLLRGLTFYGDYNKPDYALMFSVDGFWKLVENWRLQAGADATFIALDGDTWEQAGDLVWNKDQTTELNQWIFWSGLQYRF